MPLISIRAVARECKSHSEFVLNLIEFYDLPIVSQDGRRYLDSDQLAIVKDLVWVWRGRPKFGRARRTRRKRI